MVVLNAHIKIKMPNSYDDLIKLSRHYEKLELYQGQEEIAGNYEGQIPNIQKSPPRLKQRSILKNKAKSADAAIIMDLKSILIDDNNNNENNIDCTDDSDTTKNVKFADDSNLVEIRKFVPSSENMDLWTSSNYFMNNNNNNNSNNNNYINNNINTQTRRSSSPKTSFSLQTFERPPELAICFKDPYLQPNFTEMLRSQNVALDRCGVRERLVTGVVVVCNIEYQKHVFVRYTLDGWRTIQHTDAVYIPNSSDGDIDRFTFSMVFPKHSEVMEFAVCYKLSHCEYWDSNGGKNFKVQDILYSAKD